MTDKLKVICYWNAGCGGCEVTILDIHERVLDAAQAVDFVFWPILLDAKLKDLEALPDGSVDLALVNGAIRNRENAHLTRLIRRKSKILVSFGACACWGGIPALANLYRRADLLTRVYLDSESTVNPGGCRPSWEDPARRESETPPAELTLPEMYRQVYTLPQLVEVDYLVPGCPPPSEVVWDLLSRIISGDPPARGVFPNLSTALCNSCPRTKDGTTPETFHRVHEVEPDPERCLLEQGLLCLGACTRDGCGARCTTAGMPCRGCFGPADDVLDQGAKFLSTVAAAAAPEVRDLKAIEKHLGALRDLVGTAYRFTLAASLLRSHQLAAGPAEAAPQETREVAVV